ncbi:hypothetical protein JCGZ_15035 [Jatropha curcas]|uniref:Uncharacterized protein n=1 Tax=Jatropha curcas TaxID=180498 RepID=A0A067LKD9_JATCU|nr:uncharacterized protein LOC105643541 isoform X1 [Jatropha curcas]KDP45170.1 hypothetical protein JCGZ_15035 [Jatropha curcas]
MLENPTPAAQPDSTSVVKRYAPPNQRNRSLNRRKSGERFDRSNSLYANEAEKNQQHPPSRNMPVVDHGDVGSSNFLKGNSRPGLIALEGCSRSEAAQLLNDRWTLAMHNYDDASIDLSERPVMYLGSSAPAWGGHIRLPHQFMPAANAGAPPSGSQIDFLSELRRAMRNASANSDN